MAPHLSAIALEGAKAVGKTATASERAASVLDLTDERLRQILAADPEQITVLVEPVLIDEWQLLPSLWDRVRRAVDQDPRGGRFLLTGSASPAPGVRIHSGAGRIVSVTMRPMSFAERDICSPSVSLSALLNGESEKVEGATDVDVPRYVDEILRSGFPGIRNLPDRARTLALDSYLTRIVDRELPENGVSVRRPAALRAWLAAYAAATSSDASYGAILNAATASETDKPARQTVAGYRDHLQRIFVLDPVPAWIPAFSPLKRLTQSPKHHLVDPALSARLVGVGIDALLRGKGPSASARPAAGTWLGALFDSLVTQSLRVYASSADATVGHLRTKNTEHEVDLIVERADRGIVAVEVRLSGTVSDRDVRHLHWLKSQLGEQIIDLVVVNTGPGAYRRADGIAVVPLALLGP